VQNKVSIVIPVYNAARVIERLVTSINSQLSSLDFEIVLVNDGSSDDSDKVCSDIASQDPKVKFINLSRNYGEHNAVMAGLNYCTGDYAVFLDDDFQNPPGEIVKLVNKITEGYDVVFSYYEKKEHHFFRNLGSKINNYLASFLLHKPKDLYLSSFKVINRFMIDEIIKYQGSYPYIDGIILRSTDKYSAIPVSHNPREEGKSGYTFRKLMSLWLNMFTSFSILPLRIATVLGFIFSMIGLILSIVFVIEKINNPVLPIGWATVTVSIFILGSVQLFAIGMIGEYLGRLFLNSSGKPQYIIRTKINCNEDSEKR
jgi:polyisoprenyl-phosphate glycosyltransferase